MKRVDRLRIRHDDEIARLMETEAGQAEYWRRLDDECHESPLVWLLEESLALEGDVIECGVYRGGSTRLMGRRMRDMAPGKRLFACDSFEGFPQDRILDADLGPFRFRFKIRRKFRHAMDVPTADRILRHLPCQRPRGERVLFRNAAPDAPAQILLHVHRLRYL
jgi:hypothetical protein